MADEVIITIAGKIQKELQLDLVSVEVDTNLFLPAMFTIVILDTLDLTSGKLKYGDADDVFKAGAEVKIEFSCNDIPDAPSAVKAVAILGEITAIEPRFSEEGRPQLMVRGYDLSHRLTRGKKTRVYGDGNPTGAGVTDDKIVGTIAGEAGLSKMVDQSGLSGLKYPYVLQYNQTDLEFLWQRAKLLGYQVYVGDDKKLYFVPADAHRGETNDKGKPAKLTWGQNLRSFYPRLSLVGQVDKALVQGWDPHKKQALLANNSSDSSKTVPKIGLGKKGGQLAKQSFKGVAEMYLVDHPLYTQSEATAIAKAQFAALESEFIQAEGEVRVGDPRLIAGRLVTIEGVGTRFKGDYYVTQARHRWVGGHYEVSFSVSGREPNTLSHLLQDSSNGQHDPGKVLGVVTAVVTDLKDPQTLGRVRVKYPWLPKFNGAELAGNWARLASPMAGKERGIFFTPEIDDEVLVAFEHGDMNFPYIVGGLWGNKDKPPQGSAKILSSNDSLVDQRVIRSRSGHLIILNDKQGAESILIQDKSGKNKIEIDTKTNSMTINVDKDFTVKAMGKITLQATDDFIIEGKNVNVTAKMALALKGGPSGASLEGGTGAKVALSGPTVNVNNGALEVV